MKYSLKDVKLTLDGVEVKGISEIKYEQQEPISTVETMKASPPELIPAAELIDWYRCQEPNPPRPHCLQCGHNVDSISIEHNPLQQQVRVTLSCHGAIDYVLLDEHQMVDPLMQEKEKS